MSALIELTGTGCTQVLGPHAYLSKVESPLAGGSLEIQGFLGYVEAEVSLKNSTNTGRRK